MKTFTLFAIVAVVAGCGVGTKTANNARKWAREMYPEGKVVRATCMDYDSDGDSYVSCTAVVDDHEPVALECSWLVGGCRMQKLSTLRAR